MSACIFILASVLFHLFILTFFHCKVLAAILTQKLALFYVHVFDVASKREFGAKILSAVITDKVFDLFMNGLDVILKVAVLGKATGADITDEIFAILFLKCGQVHDAVASQGPTI